MEMDARQDDGTARLAGDGDTDVQHINTGWRALFSFTKKAHLITLLPALFLSTAAGILQPSLAIFFGRFFNAFSDYGGGKIDGTHLMNQTLTNVYALIGLGTATWLLKGGYFASWLCVGELHAQSVRDELFKCLLLKDLNWYETRTSGVGALLSRIQTQIRELQMGTSQPLGFVVNYSVQCAVSLGLAFFYSWRLALVTLAAVPVCAIILSMISSKIQPNALAQELEMTKASKIANNAISNITTVKCSNTQDYEGKRYTSAVTRAAVFYGKQALANSLQVGFARFAATSLFVPGLWYGQHLVNDGKSTAGKVVTTFWSCLVATKSFEDLLPHVLVLEKGRAAAIALRELLDRVARGQEVSERTEGLFPEYCEGDVEFRDIFFEYPSRPGCQVLKGTTFFFPAGETSFVVGRSGSGKSTVGNLLMRFYQPTTGDIVIDGDHIRDLSMSWIRNNITLVQQQSILFNETILRNIAFGHRDHDLVSHDHVEPALTVAGLQATIAELPKGLDNMVGMSGATLSGGQKQRVAVARSRLRDTPILILDESTSALSMDARTKIMANIRRWRQNKTTIIITHDLTQIKDDDFVYILDEGQIIAEGFRSAVAAHLENGSFKTEITAPKKTRNDQFDFGWGSRVISEESDGDLKASAVQKMAHQKKDSIDIHLEGISRNEKGPHAFSHQPASRLSRVLSRRLSGGARMVLRPMSKRPAVGQRRQILNAVEPQLRSENLSSGTTRVRLGRPMSMHQAMVMYSIYRQPSLGPKTLPSPTVFEAPKLLRRISRRTPAADVQTKKAPSIQMILATVWPQLDRKNRIFLVCGIFATLVHASQTPVLAYLLVRLFSTFYIKQDQARKALIYSVAVLSVAVLDGVAAFLMHYLLERSAETWVNNLRSEALYRIMAQDKVWFDDPQNSASNLLSDLDRNAEEMRNLVGRFVAVIMVVVTMMTIGVLWALATCWKLTLVALATAPAMYLLTKGFEIVSSRWESCTNNAGEEIGAVFVETFSDIRTVRAFTLESYFHKKYTVASSKAITVGVRRSIYSGFFFGLSDSAINFIIALIFFVGASLAKTDTYSVTSILNAFCLLLFSAANANSVVAYIPQISSSADTAARLLRLAQLPLRTHEKDGRLKLDPAGPATLSGPIHFIHMTFAYPSRPSPPALHNLNFTIPAGLCTAIVGASGSGKSTIASLLLGLYPPTADQTARSVSDPADGPPSLTLSGHDIRGLHLPTLRSLIAYVPQSPVIFPGSVRENITYGLDLNSPLTMQGSVEEAAARAGIHDFILTLPNGYSSVIGDGGLGLSGGQAQRVVIARALLRKPRLLILDEATSALDGESAGIIRKSVLYLLEEAKRERALGKDGAETGRVLTVVIITHAREMMAFADNVVVLEAGRFVEEGKFTELLSRGGKLWEMLRDGTEE